MILTRHAEIRLRQMNVTPEEVESAIDNAMNIYLSNQGAIVYCGRRISAVAAQGDQSNPTIITVLWRDPGVHAILSPGVRTPNTHHDE